MLTTFRSYGSIDPTRQGELIKSIGSEQTEDYVAPEKEKDTQLNYALDLLRGIKSVDRLHG